MAPRAESADASASPDRTGAPAPAARSAIVQNQAAIARPQDGLANESTPLLAATARGDAEAVRAALAQSADVNAVGAAGRSALMLAAQRGDAALVRLLLAAGADPQRTDRNGLNAAAHARRSGNMDLASLLDSAPQPPSSGTSDR